MKSTFGILLTNTGSPDSPALAEVKSYLKAFLSDPRIVRLPSILWKPILHTLILRKRAPYTAKLYQKIWTAAGSPLRETMLELASKLEEELRTQVSPFVFVEVGMHYGKPSIPEALAKLQAKNLEQLLVLPLFPQYSSSTTEAARDQVSAFLKHFPALPFSFISSYATHPCYIEALVSQIKKHHAPQRHLLFSFHGLPQFFVDQRDPYAEQCEQTVRLVTKSLKLLDTSWSLSYQSRLGPMRWLKPYTFERLAELAKQGIEEISVICPGFSVDCLETLEEIQIRGKAIFLKEGGKDFHYLPTLNAEKNHLEALAAIIQTAERVAFKSLDAS